MNLDLVLRISAPLLLLAVGSVQAATLTVAPDGSGDYPTIRAAIAAALPGDIVSLADGTYVGADNRNLNYLGKAIHVRSASGDPTLCIIDCSGGAPVSRGFTFQNGETSGARLSHVTILGAHVYRESGAAIYSTGTASPTISNCHFLNCTATELGGAVFMSNGSSPTFWGCRFEGNGSPWGGAVYIAGSSPTFESCRFTLNQGTGLAGAVGVVANGTGLFTNCEFDQNYSDSGGCIHLYDDTDATFDHCSFSGNEAGTQGGVIDSFTGSEGQFNYCTFTGNRANHGGVESVRGLTTYTNCTMYDNYAWNGILLVYETGHVTVDRTIISFSSHGSAVWCGQDDMATIECSNFFGNPAGNWRYCTEDLYNGTTNVSLDPLFCDAANGDFELMNTSWCAPGNNPGCGQVGAFGVGCSVAGVPEISGLATGGSMLVQPNPTSGGCQISWERSDRMTTLDIYDVSGAKVRTMALHTGADHVAWDGKDDAGREVPAGVYLARAEGSGQSGDHDINSRIVVRR